MPYAYDIEKGIFSSYGIDLKLKGMGCNETIDAVTRGEARFGVLDPLEVTVKSGDRKAVQFIGNIAQNHSMSFISIAERKFKSPKYYKGHKIAVLSSGRDKPILLALLKVNGVSESEVTLVNYKEPDDKLNALKKARSTFRFSSSLVFRNGKKR